MITTNGKQYIKRYLAGQVPAIAGSMAIGIGSASASLSDKRLQLETERVPINLIAYDASTDKLIFKAEVPSDYVGKISEIGLYSLMTDTINDIASQIISTVDQDEGWEPVSGTFSWNTTNTRLGDDSLRFSLTANSNATASLLTTLDLSRYSSSDALAIAYNASANAGPITVTLLTDSANYFTGTLTPASGFNVGTILRSAFTSTGNPSWAMINEIRARGAATSGGATNIDIDAIAMLDNDFLNPDLVLVAREVITPITKSVNSVNEIEFSMAVNV